ncbi:91_t:CDS:1, partial [Gigaspora margarita]
MNKKFIFILLVMFSIVHANPGYVYCDKTNISTSYSNASSLSVNFEEWHPNFIKYFTQIDETIPTTMYTYLEYILDTDDIYLETTTLFADTPPGTTKLLRTDNVGKPDLN